MTNLSTQPIHASQIWKRKNYTWVVIIFAMAIVNLSGCASKNNSLGYIVEYEEAVQKSTATLIETNSVSTEPLFEDLILLFSDLKHPDLVQRIENTYAENLYFNDTFRIYENRQQVSHYLAETSEKVAETRVDFKEIAKSESSYFIRWNMLMKFNIKGKQIESNSIGVSQIKFNKQGKIIFHQDFWDNTEGFFSSCSCCRIHG